MCSPRPGTADPAAIAAVVVAARPPSGLRVQSTAPYDFILPGDDVRLQAGLQAHAVTRQDECRTVT